MSDRWKMNRIGFVNFWLYDEEDFEFYDGKLLLRGQNGSGKSITTQSFIPFVLDGDRTPSRLDPFGSSDRRMEYYFLGEEGKDEATGYLFLEFKKEHTEEYRTIGIGQRAKRGKSMDFWGFIILDGQRIGRDLWLYKETGSTRIPYDKREMKNMLGESNLFTDSQSEYKKLVNQYIFGFRKVEQYEQFIRLLVKVRAPKLSKEFKPTKVYDILNESLQTLSDEDLRTMVEAMEKMDEIQDSLDVLNRAFADVKIIRNEYTRYNQYMLAKKAQSYLKKKEETEKARQEYEEMQNEEKELSDTLQNLDIRLEELSEQKKLAETERNGLLDADLKEIDRKLGNAKKEKEELQEKERKLSDKIHGYQEKSYQKEQELKRLQGMLEEHQEKLRRQKQNLEEHQETLKWDGHETVLRIIGMEQADSVEEISNRLLLYKKLVEECKKLIHDFEEISRKYDEIAEELENIRKEKVEKEQVLAEAQEHVIQSQDHWIEQLYSQAQIAEYWKPQDIILKEAERRIRQYQNIADAGQLQELFRKDYEDQRTKWLEKRQEVSRAIQSCEERLETARQELEDVRNREEIEPDRNEKTIHSRQCLKSAGMEAVPFYRTVEFADGLAETECARLEAQLDCMGLLDALVVSEKDYAKIAEACPEFLDTVIYVPEKGTSGFSKLVVSEELTLPLAESVRRILSNIYEETGAGTGIYLGEDGRFLQGILAGRAQKAEAEFLGYLTRQKKKQQKMESLQKEISEGEQELLRLQGKNTDISQGLERLESEYKSIPDFYELDQSLGHEKELGAELERLTVEYTKQEQKEGEWAVRKQEQYRTMLQKCKPFPYGRTEKEYEDVRNALEEYQEIWQECKNIFMKLETERENLRTGQEYLEQDKQNMDDAFIEKRSCSTRIKECDIQISQYEEYLSRPEIAEKARRLEQLQRELEDIDKREKDLQEERIRKDQMLDHLQKNEPQKKMRLQELIAGETLLHKFFEEELSLNLVLDRGNQTLPDCAKEAVKQLRDSDKNREYGEMLQSLVQVYQKHNSSLASYGTSIEECFESAGEQSGVGGEFQPLRKRVRVVSSWNGKKVFLEEFYQILKSAIDETEILIQQKDRELFEDILSHTISQQLTDRIAESRNWVRDMTNLMKQIDTSMGLSFSLEWKPRSAENDTELDTMELEQILLRDRELLTGEDIEKVAEHFRSKIRTEKMRLEEEGALINYMELVRDALDYRKWFEFQMFYRRGEENKKPLTNAAFNRFSGGEKAMAMYVPLFAAVNAQYKKADYEEHTRIIALDEAFAGVDDKDISSMFELVDKMDLDYIMNSQSLWGCYETVKGLRIAELHRPMNSHIVTVIRYTWNGHERVLDVQ